MNLNEDLSPADLKFLEKFGMLGGDDVEEATPPPKPPEDDPSDEDPSDEQGTPDAPAEGEPGDEGEDAPADVEPGEGQPSDEGEHKHDQESEDEGFDMDTERDQRDRDQKTRDDLKAFQDAQEHEAEAESAEGEGQEAQADAQDAGEGDEGGDQGEADEGPQEAQDDAESDAEAEQEGDGEDQPAEEAETGPDDEGEPEAEGEPENENPEPSEPEDEGGDEEAEEEMQQQEQQEPDVPEQTKPIALDAEGRLIFVGSTILSKADGNVVDENSEAYMAEVLGRWVGTDDFANNTPARMILIVERHDDEDDSDSAMKTADGRGGWAVQSNLCAVVVIKEDEQEEPEEEPEEEAEEPQQPEPPKESYFLDAEGVQLFDGDQVTVVTSPNWCDWPLEAIAVCVMAARNGVQNPALLPQNFEDDSLGPWVSADGQKCFAVGWGNTLEGIRKLTHTDDRPERPQPPVPEPTPPQEEPQEQEPEIPEAEVEAEATPEIPEAEVEPEVERKPMTKTQRQRFENLAGRIFKKAEGTFGASMQSTEVGPLLPGGVFDGEEVAKVMEVVSGGVTYRLTLSAERVE